MEYERPGLVKWHVTLDLVYDGGCDDTCQEGVERIRAALKPALENGNGIQKVYFMRLPEKE